MSPKVQDTLFAAGFTIAALAQGAAVYYLWSGHKLVAVPLIPSAGLCGYMAYRFFVM